MNKTPVLFSFTIGNDIFWSYAAVKSSEPMVLKLRWISADVLEKANDIYVELMNGDIYFRYQLTFIKQEENLWYFDIINKQSLRERVLAVEYKTPLYVKFFPKEDLNNYMHQAYYYNMEQTGILNQISAFISSNEDENRALVKFMLELNNKLDAIMFFLTNEENKKDLFKITTVGITTKGYIIHSALEIPENSFAFHTNILGNMDTRFNFASVLQFNKIKPAENGHFYIASFTGIKEDISDRMIKFLFKKERELIKDALCQDDI